MTDQPHVLLPWQSAAWQRLAPALTGGRLAHALLVVGAPGIGKRHFAGVLMRALLCEAPNAEGLPCGECRGCVQVAAGSHPDVASLVPEEAEGAIKIGPVRGFVSRLHLTSQYGRGRVGLVDPADRMTVPAANSLLKSLEEPPAGSHILLVSDRPRALLPTIRSRCQTVRLTPPAPETVDADWLSQAPAGTRELMAITRGAPLRAARLAEAGVAEARDDWLEGLAALIAGRRDPVALAEAWLAGETAALLDWLYLATADLLKCAAGAGDQALVLGGQAARLREMETLLDADDLRRLVPEIVRARRLLTTPVDTRLSLEALCIGLLDCRRDRVSRRGSVPIPSPEAG